jgi:hypothetical protein
MPIKKQANFLIYLIVAGVAIGCVALGSYFHTEHLLSQAKLAGLWLKICYPAFILLSFVVSLIYTISPWVLAFVLATSTYVSITSIFGTQAPPFEILLMVALAIPYIIASYIGLFIKRRHVMNNR